MLKRKGDEWHILYITDFCYAGIGPYAELVKDLDFDFGAGVFQTQYGYYRIEEASDIYQVWEQNFYFYWNGVEGKSKKLQQLNIGLG